LGGSIGFSSCRSISSASETEVFPARQTVALNYPATMQLGIPRASQHQNQTGLKWQRINLLVLNRSSSHFLFTSSRLPERRRKFRSINYVGAMIHRGLEFP
jgi:hypothetical protein